MPIPGVWPPQTKVALGGVMSATGTVNSLDDASEVVPDLTARRPEVVRRLLERGVPVLTLRVVFPGWGPVISAEDVRRR